MELRYAKATVCQGCKRQAKYHQISKRCAYACQFCGGHIYPCVGTIFEKSTTSLKKWFFAMYLFTTTSQANEQYQSEALIVWESRGR